MTENIQNIPVQPLAGFSAGTVQVSILRLDLIHPVVSGNKWFKLKYYLQEALNTGKKTIVSFGGAYSNHIVATAFAANNAGLQSRGLIRGDKETDLSPTLLAAKQYGMQLVFVNREQYRHKEQLKQAYYREEDYWIMEGGYGIPGSIGASEILACADTTDYTHILCAVGTGTMLSGLVRAAKPGQQLIGISVFKNQHSILDEVTALLSEADQSKKFSILHNYHFGGYAKHPPELIHFMKETWHQSKIPTDIVYTSRLLYAAKELVSKGYFPANSRVLLIHSGGLQGNASLQPGILPF